MSYKDSGHTIVIILVCWPERWLLVLKLTLVVELWVLLYSRWPPSLKRPASTFVGSTALRKAYEDSDYTAVIAFVHWQLCTKTHPGGDGVCAVIIFVSFWLPLLTLFKQHGRHVSCVLIGMRCRLTIYVIWASFEQGLSTVQAGGCKQTLPRYRVRLATRSVVAT